METEQNSVKMEFRLTEFHFRLFPLRKCLKVPFPFVSVKTNFESSVKSPFPIAAACFHTPLWKVKFRLCGLRTETETDFRFRLFPLRQILKVPLKFRFR